jgi:hypothetical protein
MTASILSRQQARGKKYLDCVALCRVRSPLVAYLDMNPAERYQRITEIFIAVCNLGGTERTRTLDTLCADCPELRGEVELLLTFHDKLNVASEKKPGSAD